MITLFNVTTIAIGISALLLSINVVVINGELNRLKKDYNDLWDKHYQVIKHIQDSNK